MTTAQVAAVVVTWNAASTVDATLRSLPVTVPVVVVDNDSADETLDVVVRTRPDATVIANRSNRGFAAASNQGLEAAGEVEHVLLLNPDAVLDDAALTELIRFADEHPAAGLVSGLVVTPGGRSDRRAGGRAPSILSMAVHELGLWRLLPTLSMYQSLGGDRPRRVDWIAGTCLLARSAAVADVGPLDEGFFLYCEDIDWCDRMRRRGWEVWVVPAARVTHVGSASVDVAGPWVDQHRIGSLDRYLQRRYRGWRLTAARVIRWAGKAGRAVVFGVAGIVLRRPDLAERGRRRRHDAQLVGRLLRRP